MKSKSVITQLRFEPALLEKITEAANKTGLSKADVMRLAMETGLEDLRRIDFDLPSLISSTARGRSLYDVNQISNTETKDLRVAEDP